MATDPNAPTQRRKSGTDAEFAASKKRKYVFVEIDLGSGRKDVVAVRGDAADYFGIAVTEGAGGQNYKIVNRSNTGRALYVDLGDDTATPSTNSTNNKHALPKRLRSSGGGKAVVVPTEKVTAKGNIRKITFHFPGKAGLAAISNFLATKITAKKPTEFITRNGVRRAVVEIPLAQINAGEETTTA
jgi:hypothetical protein